jgi:predicted transcriptional regulator
MKSSWKTTLFGALAIAAGTIVAADFGPLVTKIAVCVGSSATGIGLLFARDNNVTSEQANAGK